MTEAMPKAWEFWWQKPETPRRIFMRAWWRRIVREVYAKRLPPPGAATESDLRIAELAVVSMRLNQTWAEKALVRRLRDRFGDARTESLLIETANRMKGTDQ